MELTQEQIDALRRARVQRGAVGDILNYRKRQEQPAWGFSPTNMPEGFKGFKPTNHKNHVPNDANPKIFQPSFEDKEYFIEMTNPSFFAPIT